jgi:hypothetical protein
MNPLADLEEFVTDHGAHGTLTGEDGARGTSSPRLRIPLPSAPPSWPAPPESKGPSRAPGACSRGSRAFKLAGRQLHLVAGAAASVDVEVVVLFVPLAILIGGLQGVPPGPRIAELRDQFPDRGLEKV